MNEGKKAVTGVGNAPRMGTTVLYKLVVRNRIVAAGSKAKMKSLLKKYPSEGFPFIGIGSPNESQIGKIWNTAWEAGR